MWIGRKEEKNEGTREELEEHRRRLWGQPRHLPPIIEKPYAIISYYHRFPQYFAFPNNICTNLRQCEGCTEEMMERKMEGSGYWTYDPLSSVISSPAASSSFVFCVRPRSVQTRRVPSVDPVRSRLSTT